jgi:hypothetical protein
MQKALAGERGLRRQADRESGQAARVPQDNPLRLLGFHQTLVRKAREGVRALLGSHKPGG